MSGYSKGTVFQILKRFGHLVRVAVEAVLVVGALLLPRLLRVRRRVLLMVLLVQVLLLLRRKDGRTEKQKFF
jgi:hypothetical protein